MHSAIVPFNRKVHSLGLERVPPCRAQRLDHLFVILVQTAVELQDDCQPADDFEIVMFGRLIIDGVLSKVFQILANKDGKLDLLLDIVCQILKPEDGDGRGCILAQKLGHGTRTSTKLENDRGLVSHVYRDTHILVVPLNARAVHFSVFLGNRLEAVGCLDRELDATRGQEISMTFIEVDGDVTDVEGTRVPTDHVLGQLGLDASERERHVDLSKSLAFGDGPGGCNAGCLGEDFGHSKRNDTEDWVGLSDSTVTHDNTNNTVLPVANKDFDGRFKEWLSRVLLDSGLEDQVVIDDDLAIRRRQVVVLLRGIIGILSGLTFSIALSARQILPFDVDGMMNRQVEHTGRVLGIRSSLLHIGRRRREILLCRVGRGVIRLHFHFRGSL